MVERGSAGSLVTTSRLAAIMGHARGELYGTGKAALVGMMRALAVEYGRKGIRANSILPGWIDPDDGECIQPGPLPQHRPATRCSELPGENEDFGDIAARLVFNASRYHSGGTCSTGNVLKVCHHTQRC